MARVSDRLVVADPTGSSITAQFRTIPVERAHSGRVLTPLGRSIYCPIYRVLAIRFDFLPGSDRWSSQVLGSSLHGSHSAVPLPRWHHTQATDAESPSLGSLVSFTYIHGQPADADDTLRTPTPATESMWCGIMTFGSLI